MNRKSLAAALVLIVSAGSVLADDITIEDRPVSVRQSAVAVQPVQRTAVNVYAKDYNPLHSFQGARTRAQVTAEFLAARDEVSAFTREDSGAAWLAARRPVADAPVLAGQPVNAH